MRQNPVANDECGVLSKHSEAVCCVTELHNNQIAQAITHVQTLRDSANQFLTRTEQAGEAGLMIIFAPQENRKLLTAKKVKGASHTKVVSLTFVTSLQQVVPQKHPRGIIDQRDVRSRF